MADLPVFPPDHFTFLQTDPNGPPPIPIALRRRQVVGTDQLVMSTDWLFFAGAERQNRRHRPKPTLTGMPASFDQFFFD